VTGRDLVAAAIGALIAGIALAQLRSNEGSCCQRVAAGARERAGEVPVVGGAIQEAGDALNLWAWTPALLDLFGVEP